MTGKPRRIYWDANCFLSYLSDDQKWLPILETLLAESNSGTLEIVTSIISKTEVAFSAMERLNRVLLAEEEARIDKIWTGNKGIRVVEYSDFVAMHARDIRRRDMMRGWKSSKLPDLIHLATAQYMHVAEMHTMDRKLHQYSEDLGFPIRDPFHPQQSLPGI